MYDISIVPVHQYGIRNPRVARKYHVNARQAVAVHHSNFQIIAHATQIIPNIWQAPFLTIYINTVEEFNALVRSIKALTLIRQ